MNRKSESARYLHLIQRRLALVRELRDVLLKSREAIVTLNLEETDRRTADQERICSQIRVLDVTLASAQANRHQAQPRPSQAATLGWLDNSADDPSVIQRIRESVANLEELQLEVRNINSVNRVLLRRSTRTLNALANFVNGFAATYTNPKLALPRARF